MKEGEVFQDDQGRRRCIQPVMIADPEVGKDDKGLSIIDSPDIQCCEFIEIFENEENEDEHSR
jgi:hypothetical protein